MPFHHLPQHFRSGFQALVDDRALEMVGREFVYGALDGFLTSHDRGYFEIIAAPGVGKTSFAASLAKSRAFPHHFVSATRGTRSASRLVESLDIQLEASMNHYRALGLQKRITGACVTDVMERASDDARPGRSLVIVLDGIDEAEIAEGQNVLGLPSDLPPSVYFVLTSRPSSGTSLFTTSPRARFEIDATSQENLNDAYEYVDGTLSGPGRRSEEVVGQSFRDELVARSQGNFMYLHFVLQEVLQGLWTDPERLPIGLEAYYDRHWETLATRLAGRLWQISILTLAVMVFAEVAIAPETIAELADVPIVTVRQVLRETRPFLDIEMVDGRAWYKIYHQTFLEYLRRRDEISGLDLTQFTNSLTNAAFGLSRVMGNEPY